MQLCKWRVQEGVGPWNSVAGGLSVIVSMSMMSLSMMSMIMNTEHQQGQCKILMGTSLGVTAGTAADSAWTATLGW